MGGGTLGQRTGLDYCSRAVARLKLPSQNAPPPPPHLHHRSQVARSTPTSGGPPREKAAAKARSAARRQRQQQQRAFQSLHALPLERRYLARDNETPAMIATKLGIKVHTLLRLNVPIYAELKPTSKLHAWTVLALPAGVKSELAVHAEIVEYLKRNHRPQGYSFAELRSVLPGLASHHPQPIFSKHSPVLRTRYSGAHMRYRYAFAYEGVQPSVAEAVLAIIDRVECLPGDVQHEWQHISTIFKRSAARPAAAPVAKCLQIAAADRAKSFVQFVEYLKRNHRPQGYSFAELRSVIPSLVSQHTGSFSLVRSICTGTSPVLWTRYRGTVRYRYAFAYEGVEPGVAEAVLTIIDRVECLPDEQYEWRRFHSDGRRRPRPDVALPASNDPVVDGTLASHEDEQRYSISLRGCPPPVLDARQESKWVTKLMAATGSRGGPKISQVVNKIQSDMVTQTMKHISKQKRLRQLCRTGELNGRRVAVYWQADETWYKGVVLRCDTGRLFGNGTAVEVQYDDDDVHVERLSRVQIKLLARRRAVVATRQHGRSINLSAREVHTGIRVGQQYQAVLPALQCPGSVSIAGHLIEKQRAGTIASLCDSKSEDSIAGWQGTEMEWRFTEAMESQGKDFSNVSKEMNRLACAPVLGSVLGSVKVVTVGHVAAFYYGCWKSSPNGKDWKRRQQRLVARGPSERVSFTWKVPNRDDQGRLLSSAATFETVTETETTTSDSSEDESETTTSDSSEEPAAAALLDRAQSAAQVVEYLRHNHRPQGYSFAELRSTMPGLNPYHTQYLDPDKAGLILRTTSRCNGYHNGTFRYRYAFAYTGVQPDVAAAILAIVDRVECLPGDAQCKWYGGLMASPDDESSEEESGEESSTEESSGEEQEPGTYVIEGLRSVRRCRRNKRQLEFLVKWEGYSERESTWEPESEMLRAAPLLVRRLAQRAQGPDSDCDGPTKAILASRGWACLGGPDGQDEQQQEEEEEEEKEEEEDDDDEETSTSHLSEEPAAAAQLDRAQSAAQVVEYLRHNHRPQGYS
eukprot:COSAG01_NODE_4709_length_4799_cov_2.367660_1_plen_1030_part_10